MNLSNFRNSIQALVLLLLVIPVHLAFSQDEADTRVYHFNGDVSVTNNGFSFIPSFSLGKPATITNISMGGKKFSFDPQFRFDLAGLKPWSFIFIWRYRMIQTDKFQFKLGVHLPAISFIERTYQIDGETKEKLIPYRFITPELIPTYSFNKTVSIGMYYIYGYGLEKEEQTKHTHFLSFRAFFNELTLYKNIYVSWNPQVYYLNLDGTDGFYTAQTLSLGHKKFPVFISSMMNIKLKSDVPTKDFDWNISLVYAFKKEFTLKKK